MFNNTTNSTRVEMNQAVPGIIQKSHVKSIFQRFHGGSNFAKLLFDEQKISREYGADKYVILQVLLTTDDYYLAEIVKEADYISQIKTNEQ